MLDSHYAPRKPLYLLPKKVMDLSLSDIPHLDKILAALNLISEPLRIGLLVLEGDPMTANNHLSQLLGKPVLARSLSRGLAPEESLRMAAQNLFQEMRTLDASPAHIILSEPCNIPHGLGFAIADRLLRASRR